MKLSHLLEALPKKRVQGMVDIEIRNVVADSRKVEPRSVFVALRGSKVDGHYYLSEAIKQGAWAVVVEDDTIMDFPHDTTVIKVESTRKALARLAARFYDYPATKLKIIGVTGTNGKTTTTHMISNVLNAQGMKTGIIGTLYMKVNDEILPTKNTTPESLEIQKCLALMVDAGVEVVVMEVSSHALYFDRVAEIQFDGAVFTNLTQDHLDFHQTLDNYFAEKKKLFTRIKPESTGGFALLNSDDPRTPELAEILTVPYMSYGVFRKPDLRAKDINIDMTGTAFVAESDRWDVPVRMKMAGMFNVYNALAAVGCGLFMNVPPSRITKGLESLNGVRGRFELIDEGQLFGVVVDYAHTPDGLKNVLSSARELTRFRLIAVFGCGGDRDRTKRPLMGQIAAEFANMVIVTSDNPRTEDPKAIVADIVKGVEKERQDYIVEVDRKTAIEKAIELAREGDLIVIAGKGHETYQIFKDKTIHFDDAEVAREALRKRLSQV